VVHGLVPVIGIVVFGLAVYGSVWGGSVPPLPFLIVPYVNLGWLLVGGGILWYLKTRQPQRVARVGSILGEEGGEAAAALDQPATPVPTTS